MARIGEHLCDALQGWAAETIPGRLTGVVAGLVEDPRRRRAFARVLEAAVRSDQVGMLLPADERSRLVDVLLEHPAPHSIDASAPNHSLSERISAELDTWLRPLDEPAEDGSRVLHDHGIRLEALVVTLWEAVRDLCEGNAFDSGELRDLHDALLQERHEIGEAVRRLPDDLAAQRKPTTEPPRLLRLPGRRDHFTGRREELATLAELAARRKGVHLAVIDGMPGVGKTELAKEMAYDLAADFSDVMFLGMSRSGPQEEPRTSENALGRMLGALGIYGLPPRARRDRWTVHTRRRRLLVILDNVAAGDPVEPLIPAGDGSLVLVTSRERLDGVPGVRVHLDGLTKDETWSLLEAALGGTVAEDDVDCVFDVTAGSPLAIQMLIDLARNGAGDGTAHRTGSGLSDAPSSGPDSRRPDETGTPLSLADLCADFDDQAQVDHGAASLGGPAGQRSITDTVDVVFRRLTPEQRHRICLLAGHPGTRLTCFSASALLGTPPDDTRRILDGLTARNLLEATADGVYGFHDVLRDFAREHGRRELDTVEVRESRHRLVRCYLAAAGHADRLIHPHRSRFDPPADGDPLDELLRPAWPRDETAADAWFADERDTIVAIAATEDPPTVESAMLCHTAQPWLRRGWMLDDARLCAEHALRGFEQVDDPRGRTYALTDLSVVSRLQGRFEEADRCAQQALREFEDIPDRTGRAYALQELGVVARMRGDYSAAWGYAQAALRVFEAVGDQSGSAYALRDLGRVARRQGPYDEAARCVEAALALFEEMGDQTGRAYALRELGRVLRRQGRYDEARGYGEAALTTFDALGDRFGKGYALRDLGRVARRQGRFETATEYARQALDLYRGLGDRSGEAYSLRDLGRVRRREGDYDEAARCARQALALFEALGDRLGEACGLADLGRVRRRQGDYDKAERLAARAREIHARLGDRIGEADAICDLGRIARRKGRFGFAEANAQMALRAYRRLGDRPGQADALCDLGWIERERGEYAAAETLVREALETLGPLGDPSSRAYALRQLADIKVRTPDYEEAVRYANEARGLYATLGDRLGMANTLYTLGLIATKTGDRDLAIRHWIAAEEIYAELGVPFAETVRHGLETLNSGE